MISPSLPCSHFAFSFANPFKLCHKSSYKAGPWIRKGGLSHQRPKPHQNNYYLPAKLIIQCKAELPKVELPIARRHLLQSIMNFIAVSMIPFTAQQTKASENDFVSLPCDGVDCRPVEIKDFRVGTGRAIEPGATIVLKWTGRLADRYGWPFQREEEDYLTFVLGKDRLIPGFVQGIEGMREGGKRRLLIPGELGYKDESIGPLPNDYGDRRRLFATVLNKRRYKKAGDLVIDVQLKKVTVS